MPHFVRADLEDHTCYVCFFTAGDKLAVGEEDTHFMLFLVDRPEQLQFSDDVVTRPVVSIPDHVYRGQQESLRSRGAHLAKEQGTKQLAKRTINDAIHWLTKSHVGPQGAAQLGLMGVPMASATAVPSLGLDYPPMTPADFPDNGFETSCVGLPSYDVPPSSFDGAGFGTDGIPLYDPIQPIDPGFMPGFDPGFGLFDPQMPFDPTGVPAGLNPGIFDPAGIGGEIGVIAGDPGADVIAGGSSLDGADLNPFDQFDGADEIGDAMGNLDFLGGF